MRKKIPNKYELTMRKVRRLEVFDEKALHEPPFWRNDITKSYNFIISMPTCRDAEIFICVYDKPFRQHKVHVNVYYHDGMMEYKFNRFFDPYEIKDTIDLRVQERTLEALNELIDKGVFYPPSVKGAKK